MVEFHDEIKFQHDGKEWTRTLVRTNDKFFPIFEIGHIIYCTVNYSTYDEAKKKNEITVSNAIRSKIIRREKLTVTENLELLMIDRDFHGVVCSFLNQDNP